MAVGGEEAWKELWRKLGNKLVWVRALGAMFVLLVAGSVLLGLGSRRYAQDALAQHPASPIPASSRSSLKSKPEARAILGQLPLIFEPNQGQADPRVKFLAHGAGYSLFLDTNSAVLAMQTAPASLPGAQRTIRTHEAGGREPSGSPRRSRSTARQEQLHHRQRPAEVA